MKNKIKEMTWLEFDKRRKETSTVIIPTGSVEVYGPHLPLGTDCIVAESLANMIAERFDAVISPMIELNDASALLSFPGTINVERQNFIGNLEDLFSTLINYGFKNFLFLSGHGANIEMVSSLCRKYQRIHGIKCAQIDWWRFAAANSDGILDNKGPMAHGHASECGTSVMLYLRPDLVDMEKAELVSPQPDTYGVFTDVIRYIPFNEKTHNGTIGDATVGTAEKGKLLVEKCVNRIVSFMEYEFNK
jgi:creatinine amidohydrolase